MHAIVYTKDQIGSFRIYFRNLNIKNYSFNASKFFLNYCWCMVHKEIEGKLSFSYKLIRRKNL